MPRERRKRIAAHEPSAKLARRPFAVQENAVEAVEVGAAADVSGEAILQAISAAATEPRHSMKKKEKQQLKHDAFIDRLTCKTSPYSKVQRRRYNRRQREQVGGGLDVIGAVLSDINIDDSPAQVSPIVEEAKDVRAPKVQPKKLQIGEGKGLPLRKNQRKRALELEKLRQPLILSNPQYSSNPFQTIRTHAQNTLVKRADVPAGR